MVPQPAQGWPGVTSSLCLHPPAVLFGFRVNLTPRKGCIWVKSGKPELTRSTQQQRNSFLFLPFALNLGSRPEKAADNRSQCNMENSNAKSKCGMWIPKCALLDLCVNSLACRQCRVCLSCTPPQYGRQSHTDKVKRKNFRSSCPFIDSFLTSHAHAILNCFSFVRA